MKADDFFATPPKPERAFLSGYGSETLNGLYGIRIETEPLSFVDTEYDQELEPEISLSYLSLPSINAAELEDTRFTPDSNYEGSFYFLGQHNSVDLREIRFLNASGDSIVAEYDLLVELPIAPPSECPITIRVQTELNTGEPNLESSRNFDGLGTLVQSEENLWKGNGSYDGQVVEIEIRADAKSFNEIATYARSVITEESLSRSKINREISEGLEFLADKFKRFNVSANFGAEEFILRQFYFHKRRHHKHTELIIGFSHPADAGHWSLTFTNLDSGYLNWVPKG